ncbi:MAG: TlpA disulfide reductase family protein [Sulfuricaulis sp.]|uniref:redoxin domain-containing protein n=1 Tax=Sulfuricaulis sp. TaxID=2003553 RepID=UPI0034A3A10F
MHAATTEGLWKLNDTGFERLRREPYFQPALILDGGGRATIASERNGQVLVDGTAIDRGARPSLARTADGATHLAYVSNGVVQLRHSSGTRWSEAETMQARDPSWPTLATSGNDLRITFIGRSDHGPDALWLLRLPDTVPILIPSLAGNVTDTWLTLNFGLTSARSYYRPHDVLVTLNDEWIKVFPRTVPQGRYLFRIHPSRVQTSSGPPAVNRLGIRSWHSNGGSYRTTSEFRLSVRTQWSEHFAFASSAEEVLESMEKKVVNHDQHDLAVLANDLDLPVAAPEPGVVEFDITIANLGEGTSRPAHLEMRDGEKVLAEREIPALAPDASKTVKMPLDYDGKIETVVFGLRQSKPDFDPTNDIMVVNLWAPRASPTLPERSAAPDEAAPIATGLEPATDFTLPSATDNALIRLADYAGKVVLINWWRTSCGFSAAESPRLVSLYERYRERGLVILGVSDDTRESVAAIPEYLRRHGITWPIGLNDQAEFKREILRETPGDTPGNYLVTRHGRFVYLGLDRDDASWRRVEQAVTQALAESAPRAAAIESRQLPASPGFALLDLQGRTVTPASFEGRPLIVNFFTAETAAWAGRVLNSIAQTHRTPGLEVVGINLFDSDADVQRAIARHGTTYPVLRGTESVQTEWIGSPKSWATFFVTRDRRIFKAILESIEGGLEEHVFPRYAQHLLNHS